MESLAHRPPAEQASFWAGAICDLVLENDTDKARTLRTLGRTDFDARDALVSVGSDAIPELVRLAEDHAWAEEWNDRDSAEWKRHGAMTRQGRVASSALLALQDFAEAPDAIIRRLQNLLAKVHERDRGRRLAGVNGQLIARALHALRPRQFPPARFSETTNHLLNPEDFMLPVTQVGS